MSTSPGSDWQQEFGINGRMPPSFYSSKDDLDRTVAQAHVLRRAFDLLDLDGVLCSDNSPLIYFKQVPRIDPPEVAGLNKRFWNHGGAPVLVLIAPDQIHVHSGLCLPPTDSLEQGRLPSLVAVIDRVATAVREFLISVESGEFFRQNIQYFNPDHRVDRDLLDNLKDTREKLDDATAERLSPRILDALLCRLVFTCYLFDRGVIQPGYLSALGLDGASHLKDVLGIEPPRDAKASLYKLFTRLGQDFNGDLFSDDLAAEADLIDDRHIETLNEFFRGTKVRTGQRSFWPYDFGVIPIETISAIYERFLKAADEQAGAFYTPRFLAEAVLDTALDGFPSLLGKKFLDPACGSGIFLVGLFNRMAEEWKQANPAAPNDRRARELMAILRTSLFGVDISPTACRITAFSLYLAYLDQLLPRDIQTLQEKGSALPRLVVNSGQDTANASDGNIRCADFFADGVAFPADADLVIGNPPWKSNAMEQTPAGRWCKSRAKPVPDMQIAAAFVWKASEHVTDAGRVCFVLPSGLLFHHSTTALAFQKAWMRQNAIHRVVNLADFRWFLFEKAVHPAIVVSYRKCPPENMRHRVDYWAPKADWTVTQAEVITVASGDRTTIFAGDILQDLNGPDAPQIWKRRFWGTARDIRLIDRLSLYPRLRDHVRSPRQKNSDKPWIMAVGFQPFGENDAPASRKALTLPSTSFIPAKSENLNLFLLERDCETLPSPTIDVRRLIRNTAIFRAPHVLMAKGFSGTAFADFDVSFQDAVRGIAGPPSDRDLLVFLAAYLRSPLARYFFFHTSANWGLYRPEVHVEEVLRLPMPFPDQLPDPKRGKAIVEAAAQIVTSAAARAQGQFVDRTAIVREATDAVEPLIEEYFDILPLEKLLIDDTIRITIPSIQPTRQRMPVPTVQPSSKAQRLAYRDRVCEMLKGWAKGGDFTVWGTQTASEHLGLGMVILEKLHRSEGPSSSVDSDGDVLAALDRLRAAASPKAGVLDPVRGLMVFDRNRLYVAKPIGQRYWTQTAALNDADEIAGAILMQSRKERA
ncbi:MAG: HsdM family class I SAM-dependent methyltransferase [Isosphaeraceae bacterium]